MVVALWVRYAFGVGFEGKMRLRVGGLEKND